MELTRLSLKRDRLEGDAARLLSEGGVVTQPIHYASLAARLRPGEVAIGFRRMASWYVDDLIGGLVLGEDHLYASLLRADATLVSLDLGPTWELEELAKAWRIALGAPIRNSIGRGIVLETATGVHEATLGVRVRERLLDPLLDAAGEDLSRLYICADDLVLSLPLDALPLDRKAKFRLGDKVTIVGEVSFARLMTDPYLVSGDPSLLNFGGVDYGATAVGIPGSLAISAPIGSIGTTEGELAETRGGASFQFQQLPEALGEVEAIAALFQSTFRVSPNVLTRHETSKAALFGNAGGKRYIHIATHGWFAPESVRSQADEFPGNSSFVRMSLEERVTGFAPMTLCGLALAGANHGADSLGRVNGILTAEELCTLDLSQCELAVLSACETNVGIRRAGQGIQSLQTALYAAGARTSITSLWKVDDAATRRLMEFFYTNLWSLKMTKSEALWSAKVAMRERGHPPTHWAGWVMTGDPD